MNVGDFRFQALASEETLLGRSEEDGEKVNRRDAMTLSSSAASSSPPLSLSFSFGFLLLLLSLTLLVLFGILEKRGVCFENFMDRVWTLLKGRIVFHHSHHICHTRGLHVHFFFGWTCECKRLC